MSIVFIQGIGYELLSKPKTLAILVFANGGGYKSLISRVSPLNPLNRFQPEFISFIFVVLHECEGSHCRTLRNFLITCQKKRFFASAQNDEKAVIASDSAAIYSCKRLLHFVRNDEKSFIPNHLSERQVA